MAIYDLNDSIVFSVVITDENGDKVTPTTIALTLTAPDGTKATPAPTNIDTGTYTYTFIAEQAGQYKGVWASTTPDASYVEIANVRAESEVMLISLDEARRHLNILASSSDEELRETIIVASGVIEDLVGPVLPETKTEYHDGNGRTLIPLDHRAVSITSVTQYPGGVVPASDGSNRGYRLLADQNLALVTGEYPTRWDARTITVVYQAGIGTVIPAKVRQATREMVRHLWDTQRGPRAPRTMEPESFYPGQSFTVPRRVIELLGNLVVPGVG